MKCLVAVSVPSRAVLLAVALATGVCVAQGQGPPVFEVEVVNFPEVQTVDGSVSVVNFPAARGVMPFSETCTSSTIPDSCTIDIGLLQAAGEVHISYASGLGERVPSVITRPAFRIGDDDLFVPFQRGALQDLFFGESLDIITDASLLRLEVRNARLVELSVFGHVVLDPSGAIPPTTVPEPGSGALLAGLALLVPFWRWLQRLAP